MSNDSILNPLVRSRAWTGRLLKFRGVEQNTLPNLNIGTGLTVTEDITISQSHTITANLEEIHKFEYWEHSGSIQIASGSGNYTRLLINGQRDSYAGGLNTWNTGSSVFYPESVGRIYDLAVDLRVQPTPTSPVLDVTFIISGSNPAYIVPLKHNQSFESVIRNNVPHQHVHTQFCVFSSQELFVSGGVLLISSDGQQINVLSASILIKNG
jgi:hypothetical protein